MLHSCVFYSLGMNTLLIYIVFSVYSFKSYFQVFADGDPSFYSGKIVECSWDSDEQVWVCMRIRTDKTTPNDFNTYKKVPLLPN